MLRFQYQDFLLSLQKSDLRLVDPESTRLHRCNRFDLQGNHLKRSILHCSSLSGKNNLQ